MPRGPPYTMTIRPGNFRSGRNQFYGAYAVTGFSFLSLSLLFSIPLSSPLFSSTPSLFSISPSHVSPFGMYMPKAWLPLHPLPLYVFPLPPSPSSGSSPPLSPSPLDPHHASFVSLSLYSLLSFFSSHSGIFSHAHCPRHHQITPILL